MKRTRLEQLLSQTAVCLHGMQEKVFSVINDDFPDILKSFEERIERLQMRDYYILVAGETSSGKSCLINLILGVELLPSYTLSTTSTICEIKYGPRPKLVVHYRNSSDKPTLLPKTVDLQEPDACGKSYREQIDPYVHQKKDRETSFLYEKVEIFWQHELLKVGVVIIDSPGVGESEKMDQILMSYLPKAFAFIYVINSANAGGIQRDRLVRILNKVRCVESDDTMNAHGLAECALFVANKWDQVEEDERLEVKKHIVEKLKQFWPDGNPARQTVYVSIKSALKEQKRGNATEECDVLMEGMKSMILKAIDGRLNCHWKWVNVVLDRILFRITLFNKSMLQDRESLIERMNALHKQILALQEAREDEIVELKSRFENEMECIVEALFNHLCSSEFERKFTTWEDDEIPSDEDTWEAMKPKIKKVIEKRFEKMLAKWEEYYGVHAKVHDELIQCFQKRFRLAETDIREIEDAIQSKYSQTGSESFDNTLRFSIRSNVKITGTSPLWVTVGVASLIVSLPARAVKSIRNIVRNRMDDYRKDRKEFFTKESKKFLDCRTASKENVRNFVTEQMHLPNAMLQEYVSRIPRFLEGNKKLVSELILETRSKDEVWRSNSPVYNKCVELENMLAKFGILIWYETIASDQLNWSEDDIIGKGEFSSVYSGVLTKDDEGDSKDSVRTTNVAIKVFKQPLDCANANYFLKNEAKFRKLKHSNICQFFGAIILKDHTSPQSSRVALVVEMCEKNLRDVIFQGDFVCPVKGGSTSAILRFLDWASQIADALTHVHELKLVHKHVKMENVLVGKSDCLRLADIGIIGQDEVTEKNMIYAAPEVLQTNSYSAGSDVYSFGLMLWEMWYGSQVFAEIMPLKKCEFLAKIADGYRPQMHECKIALPKLQTIISYCCAGKADMRMTMSRCHSSLASVMKENHVDEITISVS